MRIRAKTLSLDFFAATLGLSAVGCSTQPNAPAEQAPQTLSAEAPPFKYTPFNELLKTTSYYSVVGRDSSAMAAGVIDGVRAELGDAYKTQTDDQIRTLIDAPDIDPATREKMIVGGVKGLAKILSPHDAYMTAEEVEQLWRGSPKVTGIGISFEMDEKAGGLVIFDMVDHGPAFKSGLHIGDIVTAVDGKPVAGLKTKEARALIVGDKGTPVTMTIRRMGENTPQNITITRDTYRYTPTAAKAIGDIGYVRLRDFSSRGSAGAVVNAMAALEQSIGADRVKGYILDLRGNPGGLVQEARMLVDAFVDKAGAPSVEVRARNYTYSEKTHPGDMLDGKPLSVLIDDGSASAAEIVSGSLQDHHRATVFGIQSYGKGSVQTRISLGRIWPDRHDAMKVTSAMYYLPSGASIQNIGITPDILVEDVTPLLQDHERDLDNVLANPNGTGKPLRRSGAHCLLKNTVTAPSLKPDFRDYRGQPDRILLCALDHLRRTETYTRTIPLPSAHPGSHPAPTP